MIRLVSALLLAVCPVLAQLLPAQAPTPTLSGRRGTAARLREIETVAVDPHGRIAPDLTASDFTLASISQVKPESCVYVDTRSRRTLVFLVDDLALSAEAIEEVRAAIRKFAAGMPPGDRLAILRSGAGEGDLQQLSADPQVLGRALEYVEYNPRRVLYTAGAARASAFASGALGVLRVALEGLRRLPGRKSVVLFSPDLEDRAVNDLDSLVSAARRAEVSVYGIDPAAVHAAPAGQPAAGGGATPVEFTKFAIAHLNNAAGMAGLAQRTAGQLAAARGAVGEALAGALSGPDGYYRVAYQEPDEWSTAELRLQRSGYQLLATRQVTESAGDLQTLSVPRQNSDDLPLALSDPFSADGIHVRLTPLFQYFAGASIVDLLVYFDPRGLAFRRALDGSYHGGVEILTAAFGASAQSVQQARQAFELAWTDTQYQAALRTGVVVHLQMKVPSATLQIRAVVRDNTSGRLGSASQWLEAPAAENGQLAVSGLLLYGAQDSVAEDRSQSKNPDETPGVRIFRMGDAIHYRCEVYNLTLDEQKAARIELQLTIFRRGGTVLVERPVRIDFPPAGQTAARREATGQIVFASDTQPGTYEIQLTITDALASAGAPRSTVQFAEFELRP